MRIRLLVSYDQFQNCFCPIMSYDSNDSVHGLNDCIENVVTRMSVALSVTGKIRSAKRWQDYESISEGSYVNDAVTWVGG